MTVLYPTMIVVGLAAIAWGLPAMHRLRRPFDILAALTVLAGVVAALLGTLLTVVPGFFKG
jgi:hypothetical protein